MERRGVRLVGKLLVLAGASFWLVIVAMIYRGAEAGEYWLYLAVRLLFAAFLFGAMFGAAKYRLYLWGGVVLSVGLIWLTEGWVPSVQREFMRMSCGDIDLLYDEVTGKCVER